MYVFSDSECTLALEKHNPNLICAQPMSSKCETVGDLNVTFEEIGKCTLVFWVQDPVGKFIEYLRQYRRFADGIYAITQLSWKQFLLRNFLELRWTPQFIMDGTKILSTIVEKLHFLFF